MEYLILLFPRYFILKAYFSHFLMARLINLPLQQSTSPHTVMFYSVKVAEIHVNNSIQLPTSQQLLLIRKERVTTKIWHLDIPLGLPHPPGMITLRFTYYLTN